MKAGVRIIGIDDAPFKKGDKRSFLVAAVIRYGRLEDVLTHEIEVDGTDAADAIIGMLKGKYKGQGKVIFIHSITVGGMNVVDIERVSDELKCPVICITDREVHGNELRKAVEKKFPERARLIKEVYKNGRYYISYAGINKSEAVPLVRQFGYEPVRTAHIIARGVCARGMK